MNKEELKRQPQLVSYYQRLYPSQSVCNKCGLPWGVCDIKSVEVNKKSRLSVFATCQYCWDNNDLETISACYILCYEDQKRTGEVSFSLEHLLECVKREFINSK